MNIETRVTNLENLVDSLVEMMNNQKFYTDADIEGVRKNVSDITPYLETKTAYIDDTEVVFENVPSGAISVALSNPSIDFTVTYDSGNVVVKFAPLKEVTKVTLTIN